MIRRVCAALAVAAVLAGCTPGRENEASRGAGVTDPGVSARAGDRGLTKAEVKLTIKVVDKECFGSAGCNVGYRVRAAWPTRTLNGTYEITYRVVGPEDGAAIGTITVQPDGTYTGGDEYASVPRSSTKLTVTVTEVERLPY